MKKLLAILLLGLASTAHAEVNLIGYLHYKTLSQNTTEKKLFDAYMEGVTESLMMANVINNIKDQQQIFCLPPDLPFGPQSLENVIDGTLKVFPEAKEERKDQSIVIIAIRSLEYMYPCK